MKRANSKRRSRASAPRPLIRAFTAAVVGFQQELFLQAR